MSIHVNSTLDRVRFTIRARTNLNFFRALRNAYPVERRLESYRCNLFGISLKQGPALSPPFGDPHRVSLLQSPA